MSIKGFGLVRFDAMSLESKVLKFLRALMALGGLSWA